MGLTLVEKILAAHSGREEVRRGERVNAACDAVLLRETDVVAIRDALGGRPVRNPTGVVLIPDRFGAEPGRAAAYRQARDFARSHGLEHFVALGRGGVAFCEFVDRGFAVPGRVAVAGDRQISAAGAVGCLGLRLDATQLAAALAQGSIPLEVPGAVHVRVRGTPGRWASGKDVALAMSAALPAGALSGHAVEIDGPAVDRLDLIDRLQIAGVAGAEGALAVFTPVDDAALTWLRARSAQNLKAVARDGDAAFAAVHDLDVDGLEPLVALPGSTRTVRRITELPEIEVDQVVLGGAGGGRIEELRIAARLIKEHFVHPRVRLLIIPATSRCALHAITEGLVTQFLRAGAVLLPPGTSFWGGDGHTLDHDERAVATGYFNAPGVHGPADAEVYLASPAVAAASAVMGRVAHPDEVLRSRREAV